MDILLRHNWLMDLLTKKCWQKPLALMKSSPMRSRFNFSSFPRTYPQTQATRPTLSTPCPHRLEALLLPRLHLPIMRSLPLGPWLRRWAQRPCLLNRLRRALAMRCSMLLRSLRPKFIRLDRVLPCVMSRKSITRLVDMRKRRHTCRHWY